MRRAMVLGGVATERAPVPEPEPAGLPAATFSGLPDGVHDVQFVESLDTPPQLTYVVPHGPPALGAWLEVALGGAAVFRGTVQRVTSVLQADGRIHFEVHAAAMPPAMLDPDLLLRELLRPPAPGHYGMDYGNSNDYTNFTVHRVMDQTNAAPDQRLPWALLGGAIS